MNASTSDEDQRKPLLRSYAEMGDPSERADRAVRDGTRYVPPVGADRQEIEKALAASGLLQSTLPEMPFVEDIYSVADRTVVVEAPASSWFVATFAPRLHDKVKRGADEKGWILYSPKLREWQPVRKPKKGEPRKIAVERPLFGTYGFFRPKDRHEPNWLGLDRVDGLGDFVRRRLTKEPITVPVGEVERFQRLEADGHFDGTRIRPPKVKRMDRVVVVSGPLQGQKALVEMTMGERVKVLLAMLGSVELPIDQVEIA